MWWWLLIAFAAVALAAGLFNRLRTRRGWFWF